MVEMLKVYSGRIGKELVRSDSWPENETGLLIIFSTDQIFFFTAATQKNQFHLNQGFQFLHSISSFDIEENGSSDYI